MQVKIYQTINVSRGLLGRVLPRYELVRADQMVIDPINNSFVIYNDDEVVHETTWDNYVNDDNYIIGVSLTDVIIDTSTIDNTNILRFSDVTDGGYFTKIDIGNVPHTDIVQEIGEGVPDLVLNTVIWCNKSQFTLDINLADNYLQTEDAAGTKTFYLNKVSNSIKALSSLGYDATDIKVKGQTDIMRLASPNYSNFFDLNVQMNKGVNFFNVDCTYKPYQPYIHLNPDFDGLYGSDFDDIRGLICGGDYSIALTNDAWSTYQLNNKNYQSIFDRQMQFLELQNNIQKTNDIAQAISGTFSGAASGAVAGGMVGGGYGAVAGAVIGGVTSAVGGIADIQNNEILRNQNISLQKTNLVIN